MTKTRIQRLSWMSIIFIAFLFPFLASASTVYERYCGIFPDCNTAPAWNGTAGGYPGFPLGDALVSIETTFQSVYTYFTDNGSQLDYDVYIQMKDQDIGTFLDCKSSSFNPKTLTGGVGNYTYVGLNVIGTQCLNNLSSGHTYQFMGRKVSDDTEVSIQTAFYNNSGPALIFDGDVIPPTDTTTRIIDFDPQDGWFLATTSPDYPTVDFNLHAYINEEDLGAILGVKLIFHNIDQNVLAFGQFSPSDVYLFEGQATTTGDFYFSTSTVLADGNYRIYASITRSYLWGIFENPWSPINAEYYHQFIVGQGTLLGNLSQNAMTQMQAFYASSTATSTISLASSCNPLSTSFDTLNCGAFLLVPDSGALSQTLEGLKEGFLTRIPWGYFSRVWEIMFDTSTTTLPSYSVSIRYGPGDGSNMATSTLSFDPADMIAGGGTLLDSIRDPFNGKNIRDIFYPIVQLVVALAVLFEIFSDLTGSHKHMQSHKRT